MLSIRQQIAPELKSSMPSLVFFVPGWPAPQGSKRHVGGGRMVEASKRLAPWRELVRAATVKAMKEQKWTSEQAKQPLQVRLDFWLPRPLSQPKTRRTLPVVRPDLDKLARAVNDALVQAGALADDSRIVSQPLTKRYVHPPELQRSKTEPDRPGVTVNIRPVSEEDLWDIGF